MLKLPLPNIVLLKKPDKPHKPSHKLMTHGDSERPFVVLIHGLHQKDWIMTPLAKQLQNRGFATHQHNYHSLRERIDQHSKRLNQWLIEHHNPAIAIHLVGHSLGGLVIRDFVARYPHWKIGRCVTLGTPHNGSTTAKYMSTLAAPLVGHSFKNALDGQSAPWPKSISLGVIAGDAPYGLGQLVLNYHNQKVNLSQPQSAHDGTVYVFETQLNEATDHIIMPVSHTGMLINPKVAEQTAYFLDHGYFKRR